MKNIVFHTAFIFSLTFLNNVLSQTTCNNTGDLVIFSNYDGGTLTINVDQNIPNLKIGVCSYEGVAVVLTGAFVNNVVAVRYAGYNGSNNHCGQVINTSISGAPSTATTSIAIMPSSPVSNPNGYSSIICAYSCNNNASQGGCNTVDQVEAYFLGYFSGSTLRSHKVQYGCWSGTQSVSIGGTCCPPVPVLPGSIAGSQTICAGQTPTLISNAGAASGGAGTITYSWQASGNAASGYTNIPGANALTYAPGSLNSTVYFRRAASTATNNVSYSNVIAVTVNPAPNLLVTGGSGICPNSTLALTASGASSYTWLPFNLTAPQLTLNALSPGSYTVIGVTASGCSATAVRQVSLHQQPAITVSGPSSVCPGAPALLQAGGGILYSWSPGNLTGSAITVTALNTTTYTVTGTDANTCTNTATYVQSLFISPVLTVTPGGGVACKGKVLTLTAAGAGSYTWSNGSTNIISNPLTFTPAVSVVFTVTGKSQDNCSGQITFPLTVHELPVITVSLLTQPVCSGKPAVLSGAGALNYTWSPGSITGQSVSVTSTASTVYTLSGDDGNCTNTATLGITVLPSPLVNITTPRAGICSGESTKLTASGASSYSWVTGTQGITSSTINVNPLVTTNFSVVGTATNSCDHLASITVSVSACNALNKEWDAGDLYLEIFPNPSRDRCTIKGNSDLCLELVAIHGKCLEQLRLESKNNYTAELSGLSPGVYLLRMKDGTVLKQKIVVAE